MTDLTAQASQAARARRYRTPDNAGVLLAEYLEDVDLADVRAQFELNAIAPPFLTRALAPRLHTDAKVVLISSRMGSIGDNGSGAYY